jgi:hypothetical protein
MLTFVERARVSLNEQDIKMRMRTLEPDVYKDRIWSKRLFKIAKTNLERGVQRLVSAIKQSNTARVAASGTMQ